MATPTTTVQVMIAAARKAARGLARDFGEVEALQVSRKGPGDFVSAADRKAEKVIHQELSSVRPGYGFVMEESGVIEGTDKSHVYYVDPLDGTTNFLHAIPHFAVSIGLKREDELIAGVVFNPIQDELYWAEKGRGAYLNDRRLRVSTRANLADTLIATGTPWKGRPGHARFLTQLHKVMGATAGIRRMGSAALDLAYVAAGRVDAFWESGLNSWDVAAGLALVREAGGVARDLSPAGADGHGDPLTSGDLIAGPDAMVAELRPLLDAKPG